MYDTNTASANGPVATRGERARGVASSAGSPTAKSGPTLHSIAARPARPSPSEAPRWVVKATWPASVTVSAKLASSMPAGGLSKGVMTLNGSVTTGGDGAKVVPSKRRM